MATRNDGDSKSMSFIASGVLLVASAASGAISFVLKKQNEALDSAVVVRGTDLASIKDKIEAAPNKRLYVKMSGQVASKAPLKVKTQDGLEHSAVLTCSETSHLYGLNMMTQQPLRSHYSTADEVTMELGVPANNPGPKIIIDPRCLELAQPTQVDLIEKPTGNRFLSIVAGLVGISYPYRSVTATLVVSQNRHLTAALDAVTDTNGCVNLVRPNTYLRRSVLTAEAEQSIKDNITFYSNVSAGVSMGAGIAGIFFAAMGFKQ